MSVEYKVVNPATGAVESEFPTATDAEIAAARSSAADAAYRTWGRDAGGRAGGDAAPRGRPLRRARRRARAR